MQQEVPAKMKVAELHQLNVGRKEFDPLQAEVPNLPEKKRWIWTYVATEELAKKEIFLELGKYV